MATDKADEVRWQERVKPLMARFRELNARMTWEGYVSLNTDRPQQKDIILQHWYTVTREKKTCSRCYGKKFYCGDPCYPCGATGVIEGPTVGRYYIVQIWADGSG